MDQFIAKVMYLDEGAAVGFGENCLFSEFHSRLCDRIPELDKLSFKLKYNVHPDPTSFKLETELDMKLLYTVLARQNSTIVDVSIHQCFDVSSSNTESVVSNSIIESNEFLGCFRREDAKHYLSTSWKSVIHSKGQIFEGGVKEFRTKLRMFSAEVGFEYTFVRNHPDRVFAVCKKKESEGCNWFVKASLCRNNGFFVIYDLMIDHQCRCVVRLQKSSMLSSQIVKEVMLHKIRENPSLKAIDIQSDMKLNYGFDIPYHIAWYGKERARDLVLGVESESYRDLIWFANETVKADPSTNLKIELADSSRFKRMFVCYGAWKKGFQLCRPVIHLDATFITNKYKGMLLCASTKDGNCGLYPIAYAIVDSENEDNGTFFLKSLSEVLSGFPERQITFISDRNLGLLKSVRSIFPNSPHGFCYRHLQANLTRKYPASSIYSKKIPWLFMCCAYSRTREQFDMNFEQLKFHGGDIVNEFLKDLPLETWACCFFDGKRFGEMTNNLAECFNSWIKDLKSLPIVELNIAIRQKSMTLIASRKTESEGWLTELCPEFEKKLASNLNLGRHWLIRKSDTFIYEIDGEDHSVMVNLQDYTCTCGEWQIHGFPCSHALLAIQNHGGDMYSYVNPIFKVSSYRSTYSFTINPVPTISKAIEKSKYSMVIEPPLTKRPPGRPRENRFKSKNEVKRQIKCGRCKKYAGHNRKSCLEPI